MEARMGGEGDKAFQVNRISNNNMWCPSGGSVRLQGTRPSHVADHDYSAAGRDQQRASACSCSS